jgi:hypothetical protein
LGGAMNEEKIAEKIVASYHGAQVERGSGMRALADQLERIIPRYSQQLKKHMKTKHLDDETFELYYQWDPQEKRDEWYITVELDLGSLYVMIDVDLVNRAHTEFDSYDRNKFSVNDSPEKIARWLADAAEEIREAFDEYEREFFFGASSLANGEEDNEEYLRVEYGDDNLKVVIEEEDDGRYEVEVYQMDELGRWSAIEEYYFETYPEAEQKFEEIVREF